MTSLKISRFPSACRGGLLAKLLVLLAALFAVGALVWMAFLPTIITRVVAAKTGFTVKIQSLYLNPFTACADVKGLVIENPPDFPSSNFVEMRRFKAAVSLTSLLSDRLVVEEAIIDLPGSRSSGTATVVPTSMCSGPRFPPARNRPQRRLRQSRSGSF